MKIGITGSHGVGKTTFANSLHRYYVNQLGFFDATIIQETIRECPYPINDRSTCDTFCWLIDKQFAFENYRHRNNVCITDRTVIDPIAYGLCWGLFNCKNDVDALLYYIKSVPPQSEEEMNVKRRLEFAIDYIHSYDEVYLCTIQPESALVDDGVRDTNINNQRMVQETITELLEQLHVPYVIL